MQPSKQPPKQPPMQTRMLIGTDFEAGAEEAEIVLNPATGETILELPEASAEQIDRAVAAAGKAFQSWRRPTPAERPNALRSEEHTSELQSLMRISYAIFCLKKNTP